MKVTIPSNLLRRVQWELAADHGLSNLGTLSTLDRGGFLIFVLVFVSRDFDRNVSCEESPVSACTGLIYVMLLPVVKCQQRESRCISDQFRIQHLPHLLLEV